MNRSLIAAALLLPFLLPAVAGCAQPEVPREHYYRLITENPAAGFDPPILGGSLMVEPLVGNGLTNERPLLYSSKDNPLELQQYHYHYWVDTPPRMLQVQMISYLRAHGLSANVFTPETRLLPDYALSGRINRLERVIGGASSDAVIELEISVSDARDGRVILRETYLAEEPTGDDMASVVEAFNRGFAIILRKVVADLERSLAS